MNPIKDILITGATGFVGAHLIKHYTKLGHNVTALGRAKIPPKALLETGAQYFVGDITKDNLPQKTDILIHTAGLASDTATWKELYNTNVNGTKNLIAKTKHKLFVYISSSSVYPISNAVHAENEIINPDNLNNYGKSKYLAEQVITKYKSYTILRPRAIYGTHDRVLLPRILGMKKRNKIISPCDLNKSISMTNIDNLKTAIDLCVENTDLVSGKTYNIVDDNIYNLNDIIYELLTSIFQQKLQLFSIPHSISKSLCKLFSVLNIESRLNKTSLDMICHNHLLDISKIKSELGYESEFDFKTTLPMIKLWLSDKDITKFIEDPSKEPWL